ncbi:ATP-binding cassette domain-containing protein [Rhodobacterales bacterium HKCCE3408]|nr:ATP-binding cassette domain-containing protein [Rhodobacterales bacterium HKCCE3408]
MIALEGLEVTRGRFRLALSLDVAKGARLALVGKSGAGKSTLLDAVAGFLKPQAGRILIDGRDVTGLPVAQRGISILFQDGNLFPHLDVTGNVALGLPASRRRSGSAEVADALKSVGLDGYGDRRPGDLSGGQQARVALARILLQGNPVALMDEPFASLDPTLRAGMAGLIADLAGRTGLTIVMVTHDLRGLDDLVTDIALLEDGQLAVSGRAADLRADPPEALKPWL